MFAKRDASLYLPAIDLWVDASRRRDRGYVSHAHADHAREHDVVICTPETAALCAVRFRSRKRSAFETHRFNEPWEIGEYRLTLFPAGHVLGSAQLLVEGASGRHVYTGDFKLTVSRTAEATEIKPADVLVMECTFGSPQYVFPPREQVEAEIVGFARAALEDGATPVFYAYSLGKAQEAMAMLGAAGIPIRVHSAVATIAAVYRACGVALPEEVGDDASGGYAEIRPPGRSNAPPREGKTRSAMLTGWAIDRSARYRYGVDRTFALSDHADYPSLLQTIERVQPRKVLLVHGRDDFTHRLRRLGIDAEYLEEHAQLSLF